MDVVKLSCTDRGRRHVLAAFGHGIADEVLRGREYALAQVRPLQAARVGDAHGADEIGILAVGLAHPPPAWIAGHVHDRRQRLEQAHGPHLAPDDVRHLFRRRGVPRRRKPDRGGERAEVGRHHAAHRFVVEDRRDLEPRLRDQVALDGVDRLGEDLGRLVPNQAKCGHRPDAVFEQGVELAAVRPLGVEQRQRKDRGQLHDLFIGGHLPQQLVRALRRGPRCRGRCLCRCCRHSDRTKQCCSAGEF
jgi:hypothetical protein